MSEVNYKSVFQILKDRYPSIAAELAPEPEIKDFGQIPGILCRFQNVTGYTKPDIRRNLDESMLLFVSIIIKAYDPGCFVDQKKKMTNGLRAELTKVFGCDKTWISHLLKIVRTQMRIHRAFRDEVNYLYSELISSGADENRKH